MVKPADGTEGRYRIQAVAEMTGISPVTLRAWERRYGIPTPARTSSAYRLYSDRDLALLKRLRDLSEQGIAPKEAARMVLDAEPHPSRSGPEPLGGPEVFDRAAARLIEAATRFDPHALEHAVQAALVLGSATMVFERVFAPVLREIGRRWQEGAMSVAEEHLASEVIGSATRDLLRLLQPEGAKRVVLLACLEHEDHVLPLCGAGLRFTQWGFRVVLLGARTPPAALRAAREAIGPDLIGLSLSVPPPAKAARALISAYATAAGGVPWVLGGSAAQELKKLVEDHRGWVAMADPERERARVLAETRRVRRADG